MAEDRLPRFVRHAGSAQPPPHRVPQVIQDPGKRTTGTEPRKYAITGPGWSGTLPAGVTEYESPTAMVWVLGRIYCTGTPEDYKAVGCDSIKWTPSKNKPSHRSLALDWLRFIILRDIPTLPRDLRTRRCTQSAISELR